MNYSEIQNLFGTPLSQVPKPNLPFKWKTWHIIGVLVISGIVSYGIYAGHRDLKELLKKLKENGSTPSNKEE